MGRHPLHISHYLIHQEHQSTKKAACPPNKSAKPKVNHASVLLLPIAAGDTTQTPSNCIDVAVVAAGVVVAAQSVALHAASSHCEGQPLLLGIYNTAPVHQ